MKIYSDKLYENEIINNCLDLGIVEAGESKQFTFYIKNTSKATLKDLTFRINHDEVKILKAPESLNPDEIGVLLIEWSPSVTLKEGLHTDLVIEGKEIWM